MYKCFAYIFHFMPGVHRGQKKMSDPQKLELWVVVGLMMWVLKLKHGILSKQQTLVTIKPSVLRIPFLRD